MPTYFLIAAGGAIGACARHAFGAALNRGFPLGTMGVNVLGSLAMGLLAGWVLSRGEGESARLFLGVGLLGGFTTFSAFSLDAVILLERREYGAFAGYVGGSVVLGIAALFVALIFSRRVFA